MKDSDINPSDILDNLYIELVDSVQQTQYKLLDNHKFRPDQRVTAIIKLHKLETYLRQAIVNNK